MLPLAFFVQCRSLVHSDMMHSTAAAPRRIQEEDSRVAVWCSLCQPYVIPRLLHSDVPHGGCHCAGIARSTLLQTRNKDYPIWNNAQSIVIKADSIVRPTATDQLIESSFIVSTLISVALAVARVHTQNLSHTQALSSHGQEKPYSAASVYVPCTLVHASVQLPAMLPMAPLRCQNEVALSFQGYCPMSPKRAGFWWSLFQMPPRASTGRRKSLILSIVPPSYQLLSYWCYPKPSPSFPSSPYAIDRAYFDIYMMILQSSCMGSLTPLPSSCFLPATCAADWLDLPMSCASYQ